MVNSPVQNQAINSRSDNDPIKLNNLKIISINVNSIIKNQRRYYLFDFIENNKPDIVLLSETKLKFRNNFTLKDYDVILNNRNKPSSGQGQNQNPNRNPNQSQGGGTGIIIKNNIKHEVVTLKRAHLLKTIELSIIKIKIDNQSKLFVISMYAPTHGTGPFSAELSLVFDELKLNEGDNYYILAGDLNGNHPLWATANTAPNPRGTNIFNWFQDNRINFKVNLIGPSEPTFASANPNHPAVSYLDICLADSRIQLNNLINNKLPVLPYDSDHQAILINCAPINTDKFILERASKKKLGFIFKKMNFEIFLEQITLHLPNIPTDRNLTNEEIDEFVEQLDFTILNAMQQAIPTGEIVNSFDKYLNNKIKRLQKKKSSLVTQLNRAKKANDQHLYNLVRTELDRIKQCLENEFRKRISNYWKNEIKQITVREHDKFFNKINRIYRFQIKTGIESLHVGTNQNDILIRADIDPAETVKDNNDLSIISDPVQKTNLMGAYLAGVYERADNIIADENEQRLHRLINDKVDNFKREMEFIHVNQSSLVNFSADNPADNPCLNEEDKYFCSLVGLNDTFYRLNNKKSSSHDKIPNFVLRRLPDNIIRAYAIIFNNILNNTYFPKKWKKAQVICIPKKGKNANNMASYRPISLLPNISKAFEIVINNKINRFCDINKIIPNCQFGFRYNHSTEHAIHKVTSEICWAINNNEFLGSVLIDLEKAFDSVWLEGLIYKLIQKKFPIHLTRMIWEMITDKSFFISDGPTKSDMIFKVKNGLQQGTVNAPILFNIYTSDLPKLFGFADDPTKSMTCFADDVIISVRDKNPVVIQDKLENAFHNIKKLYNTWKLKVNDEKSEAIIFRPLSKNVPARFQKYSRDFKILTEPDGNNYLENKTVVKYLGIHLDQRLKFSNHVKVQLEKARKAYLCNASLFHSKQLDNKAKLVCYQLLVRPLVTYGSSAWFNISPTDMEKLRVFERRCLRACTGIRKTPESEFRRYFSNEILYKAANIPRIDNFIIRNIRNYIARSSASTVNDLIKGPYFPNVEYWRRALLAGYAPIESFMLLDNMGLITNNQNVPIFYHKKRHKYTTIVDLDRDNYNVQNFRYSTSLPPVDSADAYATDFERYWWRDPHDVWL